MPNFFKVEIGVLPVHKVLEEAVKPITKFIEHSKKLLALKNAQIGKDSKHETQVLELGVVTLDNLKTMLSHIISLDQAKVQTMENNNSNSSEVDVTTSYSGPR